MDIRQEFGNALAREWTRDGDDPEVLPVQLARAAAAALGVDGAGLSIHDTAGHSTPLGANDEAATTAERLQFTAGAGPCTFAASSGWPVFAPEDQLRTRWPAFHDLLLTHTAFRSVVALALPGDLRGSGALDLYLTHPVGLVTFDAVEALCVAELISDQLGHAAAWSEWTEVAAPAWTNTEAARQRARVWMSTGMVSLALRLQTSDALAVLRSRAYAVDRTVDDLAADLVAGRLTAQQLGQDAASDR
ncbi:ANTAR domain-containing protein [Geodermatophilus sp. URMC 65]